MATSPLTIVFGGMLAGNPYQGGATWAVLQYVLGLRRLGHRVYVVEPIDHPTLQRQHLSLATAPFAAYFHHIAAEFDLEGCAALLLAGTHETIGLPYEQLRRVAQSADLLINVSGMLADDDLLAPIPRRVYLDLDPAFVQLWHETQGIDMRFAAHTHFVTIGLAIGQPDCTVPTCGLPWITTLQPVFLDAWPMADAMIHNALTTVANWRGYGSIEHDGVFYGQKAHALRPLISLPTQTDEHFMLALAIHPDERNDLVALADNGWELVDPAHVASNPAMYHRFIQGSKAEFGVAKSGYVVSRCGWFSDRSVCYLASGRPVIAQQTGWTRFLPSGQGLFAFESCADVLSAIDALNGDYAHHRRTAREIAQEFFDSDRVLGQLLDRVGSTG